MYQFAFTYLLGRNWSTSCKKTKKWSTLASMEHRAAFSCYWQGPCCTRCITITNRNCCHCQIINFGICKCCWRFEILHHWKIGSQKNWNLCCHCHCWQNGMTGVLNSLLAEPQKQALSQEEKLSILYRLVTVKSAEQVQKRQVRHATMLTISSSVP